MRRSVALRAERHADAEFASPLCDAVRDDAIQSDRRERDGDERECRQQREREPARPQQFRHQTIHRRDIGDRLVAVELMNGARHSGHRQQRLPRGPHDNRRVTPGILFVRYVDLSRRFRCRVRTSSRASRRDDLRVVFRPGILHPLPDGSSEPNVWRANTSSTTQMNRCVDPIGGRRETSAQQPAAPRGMARSREIAVRAALVRLGRESLGNCSPRACCSPAIGSAAGFLIAWGTVKALMKLGPVVFQPSPPALSLDVLFARSRWPAHDASGGDSFGAPNGPKDPQRALRDPALEARAPHRSHAGHSGDRSTLARGRAALGEHRSSSRASSACSVSNPECRDHLLTMNVRFPEPATAVERALFFYNQLPNASMPSGVSGAATTSLVPFSGDYDRVGISKILVSLSGSARPEAEEIAYVVSPRISRRWASGCCADVSRRPPIDRRTIILAS